MKNGLQWTPYFLGLPIQPEGFGISIHEDVLKPTFVLTTYYQNTFISFTYDFANNNFSNIEFDDCESVEEIRVETDSAGNIHVAWLGNYGDHLWYKTRINGTYHWTEKYLIDNPPYCTSGLSMKPLRAIYDRKPGGPTGVYWWWDRGWNCIDTPNRKILAIDQYRTLVTFDPRKEGSIQIFRRN
ncbi:hypothetical protein ACFL0Z_01605 [Patescibacteria group bacterium]